MTEQTITQLFSELKQKDFYNKFIKENPDAFLAAGFFVLDLENNYNKYQLDFFIPQLNKIAIAEYPFKEIKIQEDEITEAQILNENPLVDLDDLIDEINKLKIKNDYDKKTNKIIAILKDNFWSLTCMSITFDILKIRINSLTGECEKFEKANLMNFIDIKKKTISSSL
ncbi:MAG: hypothetical protein Q7S33_00450 [Nanoarchaeota archaeon]|nr:hypothetical protein [Nanoarchaeota archaeon]